MRRIAPILFLLAAIAASAQTRINVVPAPGQEPAASQLADLLRLGGCQAALNTANPHGETIYVGMPRRFRHRYRAELASLADGGYMIVGDGKHTVLHGAGEKGTLYAVYSFLEELGYRLYTPAAMVVPDVSRMSAQPMHIVSNPAFEWREVSYHYPARSQLYADWHHLNTSAERNQRWGMFVHTFARLLPPSSHFASHPEWYSLNNGRRSRDGQLCLSNPEVIEALCARLAEEMALQPEKRVWSVSPNDNYNACECDECRRQDSLLGGQSGTLIEFVNQVARRFPDKTIATLAYQYTRRPPSSAIIPDSNVLVMLCPIEAGREQPIATSATEAAFRDDLSRWNSLCDNLFLWDYVVQFRNFWNPFPNLHVLQPNLQFFHENGVTQMFEQASGDDNITSWMDIRCYLLAKLLWNPYIDTDSLMADFYHGYYDQAAPYVKTIIDTMTATLTTSGQRLNIYGYPIDGCFNHDGKTGYLSPSRIVLYHKLMGNAIASTTDSAIRSRLRYFELSLDFATVDLVAAGKLDCNERLRSMADSLVAGLQSFGVPQMMEMGITPAAYGEMITHLCDKTDCDNMALHRPAILRAQPTPPYSQASLTDGEAGIMDYRHRWAGFWGDTLDATVDLGAVSKVDNISMDFFFYPLSWIFLPRRVTFLGSTDGHNWQPLFEECPSNPEILATPSIRTISFNVHGTEARYIRAVAEPLEEIPAWHRAAGQKPWIFADELIISR